MFMDIDNSYVILNLICLIAFIVFWYFWNNRVDNLIMDVCFSCILCICWSFIYFYDAWIYPIVYLCCERMPLYSNCRLVNKFCDWVTRYKSFYYRYEWEEDADKILDYYRASKGAFLCIQKIKRILHYGYIIKQSL